MRIAYIAPELPGLSSTFVYKEVFALEELGIEVVPFSIHKNLENPKDTQLIKLKFRTEILYSRPVTRILKDNLHILLFSPRLYLFSLLTCLSDSFKNFEKPRIASGILFRFLIAGSLAKNLLGQGVDHIHAHFAHFPTDIAMYAGMLTKIPFSFTAHANDIFSNRWLVKEKINRAKFVATISEFNVKHFRQMGFSTDTVHVIRCGINHQDYPAPAPRSQDAVLRLGFVGRLIEKKGANTLIEACKLLKDKNIDFELDILGDGPLMDELKGLTCQFNLQKEVHFWGKVNNSQVFPWLNSIDLFILPAQRDREGDMDGIPVAIMEAMLCEVPVISTVLSGIPELVKHKETGLLSAPGNPADLAECIRKLGESPELRRRLTENAKILIGREFNSRNSAKKLMALFL